MGRRLATSVVLAATSVSVVACGTGDVPGTPDASADATAELSDDVIVVPPPWDAGGCGANPTTLSGRVLDPAGKNPVPLAIVYIASSALDPLAHGATCNRCAEPLSGAPVASAITDAEGRFRFQNPPTGPGVRLVVQIGKWRRESALPNVTPCTANVAATDATRLPKNRSEGELPRIALVPGVDGLRDLVVELGIDPQELTPPSGNGTVHVYPDATSAADLFGSSTTLMSYDAVLTGCDESTADLPAAWHANMAQYLDAGGRLYATHHQLRWFSEPSAPPELRSAATWTTWSGPAAPPYLVDITTPKTKALADWSKAIAPSSTYGQMVLPASPHPVMADIGAPKGGVGIRMVYPKGTTASSYLSITTPTTIPPGQRCGRAILADLHEAALGSEPIASRATFPGAFEFMFFALLACAQDDMSVPELPPLN